MQYPMTLLSQHKPWGQKGRAKGLCYTDLQLPVARILPGLAVSEPLLHALVPVEGSYSSSTLQTQRTD